jgi:hypothetical protein
MLDGKIHIVGVNEPPRSKQNGAVTIKAPSVLTSLDLKTGKTRHTELTIREGHSVLPLGDGRLACVAHHARESCVVDAAHSHIRQLAASEGYMFGGHGLILPERGAFVLPAKRAVQMSAADKGRFLIYDLKSLAKLDEVEAAGIHPHELRFIPGTREIAVTHYGDIGAPHPFYEHNVVAPELAIYDAGTLKTKRRYAQDGFDAMLTHMSITPDGEAYCVLTQYFSAPPDATLSPAQQQAGALAIVTKVLGHAPDFEILAQGVAEGRIAMPLPVLRINTQNGAREVLMVERNGQLRSQSVACNQTTSVAAAVYFHSNTLFVQKPGAEPVLISGKKLGLEKMRGVAEIRGTPFLAVTGSERGAIILDTRSLEVAARYATTNGYAPHVEYETT